MRSSWFSRRLEAAYVCDDEPSGDHDEVLEPGKVAILGPDGTSQVNHKPNPVVLNSDLALQPIHPDYSVPPVAPGQLPSPDSRLPGWPSPRRLTHRPVSRTLMGAGCAVGRSDMVTSLFGCSRLPIVVRGQGVGLISSPGACACIPGLRDRALPDPPSPCRLG